MTMTTFRMPIAEARTIGVRAATTRRHRLPSGVRFFARPAFTPMPSASPWLVRRA